MKVSSRDCLDVLRRFKVASDDNAPRNIENLKVTNPSPINTLAKFKFNKQEYYLLFDDTADDNVDYIIGQIQPSAGGRLLQNEHDSIINYSMPFKGKDCYLFLVSSQRKRLDAELARLYPENSRSTWQKYIKDGYVKINDKVVNTPKYEILDDDDIKIDIPKPNDYSKEALPIIYSDDNVIVVNKPAGVLTHSKGVRNDEFTVAEFLKRFTTYNKDTNRPGIIHRLDRGTSGVIIGARNAETTKLLQKQFSDRKVKKTYYAVVVGRPKLDQANIDLPIHRNPSKPSTFRVDANGKNAFTEYQTIAQNDKCTLLKLQPRTGRTHQLRVHMKYIGTPILGDQLYGKASDRLYLHAHSLEITIPSGNRQVFTSPLPDEFTKMFPGIDV